MKTLLTLLLATTVFIQTAQGQTNPSERFIEVTGEGEIKVDPNIIFLSIELREYKKDGKILKLSDLETQLTNVLQTIGIPAENLKAYASSGRQYDAKMRKPGLLIGKRYNLKVTDIDLLNPLLAELAEANIFSVAVSEVTHTDIDKYKTEAKVKAINNAKEKASLLTSTLDSKLGQVINIRETELINAYPLQSMQGRVAGMQTHADSYPSYYVGKGEAGGSVNFEQIKLTYKIVVKFKID